MATNKISFIFEINDAGKVKVDGITKSFVSLDKALSKTTKKLKESSSAMKGLGGAMDPAISNAGLAGATLTELGRTISDLPFGIRGVANNLSQLSSLFVTLVAKSDDGGKSLGGVKSAFSLLLNQLKGPLGIILVFQSVIALFDALANDKLPFFKDKVDEAAESTRDFALSVKSVREELRALELSDSLEEQALGIDKLLDQLNAAQGSQEGSLENIAKRFKEIQELRREEARLVGEEQLPKSLELVDAEISLNNIIKEKLESKNDETLTDEERLNLSKQLISAEDTNFKLLIRRDRLVAKIREANKRELEEGVGRPGGVDGLLYSNEFIEKEKTGSQLYAEEILKGYKAIELGAKKHTLSMEEINFRLALIDAERLDHFATATDALAGLFGERTAAGKAFAVATATIDAYSAGNAVLKDPYFTGRPYERFAAMTAIIATGLANVKNILSVDESGEASESSDGTAARNQAPIFNVVGQSNIDQIGRSIATARQEPLRAYVVESDITSAQQLENARIQQASIG